jgi:TolB-like protein/DNA-binding winged helix-turn-helix (wHTH) protein
MDAARPSAASIRFADFEVDFCSGELRRAGEKVRLQEQPFQVLSVLLHRPGEVVTREELSQHIWPAGTFVDFDHALNTAIKKIRCALEDDASTPQYVETIPRRGYRFIAQVHSITSTSSVTPALLWDVECDSTTLSLRNRRSLRPLFIASAFASIVLATALLARLLSPPVRIQAAAVKRMTLVVLPFENLNEDKAAGYFSDGLCEELTTQLGRLAPDLLGVTARTAAVTYRQTHESVSQIGKDLNAEYFIEGSVRHDAQRVRVTAQLIRVTDQTPLWADDFDRPLDYTLTLQSEVAKAIAHEVSARLLPATQKSSR